MNYTYGEDVFITYTNTRPNLHVRLYLNSVLTGNNSRITDPFNTNSYIADNIMADNIDGGIKEPLVIPRINSLDKQFREAKYFNYAINLKDLDIGYYNYIIEVREPDIIGTKRTIGNLIENKTGEFLVSQSPLDRIICVGNNQEGNPVYKSLTEAILATYRSISLNSVVNGVYGTSDLVIEADNLKDGEVLLLTLMKGDPEIMKYGYSKEIEVQNGRARLELAPDGDYKVTIKSTGEYFIISHPSC